MTTTHRYKGLVLYCREEQKDLDYLTKVLRTPYNYGIDYSPYDYWNKNMYYYKLETSCRESLINSMTSYYANGKASKCHLALRLVLQSVEHNQTSKLMQGHENAERLVQWLGDMFGSFKGDTSIKINNKSFSVENLHFERGLSVVDVSLSLLLIRTRLVIKEILSRMKPDDSDAEIQDKMLKSLIHLVETVQYSASEVGYIPPFNLLQMAMGLFSREELNTNHKKHMDGMNGVNNTLFTGPHHTINFASLVKNYVENVKVFQSVASKSIETNLPIIAAYKGVSWKEYNANPMQYK